LFFPERFGPSPSGPSVSPRLSHAVRPFPNVPVNLTTQVTALKIEARHYSKISVQLLPDYLALRHRR
jgi:hypothetical protein